MARTRWPVCRIVAWLRGAIEGERRAVFAPLPLFHVYSNVGIQSMALLSRLPIALVPNPRDIDDLLSTLRNVKPGFFNGVPTLYVALLNHPAVQQRQGGFQIDPDLRVGRIGAAGGHEAAL